MNIVNTYTKILVALLSMGSAILFSSCKDNLAEPSKERTITQQTDSLTQIDSENGLRKRQIKAPIMEQYGLAEEPYTEFRKGISVTTYEDSTLTIASTLVADYAIHLEKQQLLEARGNVIVKNSDGRSLETEQLFWDQKQEKIYSNVETKINDGENVIIGVGFESDQEFKDYTMRKPKGHLLVDTKPTQPADTTKVDTLPNQ